MMTSLFTGVSGMQANQTYLDVISNNVSNSNTVGYKAEQVSFSEVLNQTISGASAPDASGSYGGTNPMQMGLGVGVACITTNTSVYKEINIYILSISILLDITPEVNI